MREKRFETGERPSRVWRCLAIGLTAAILGLGAAGCSGGPAGSQASTRAVAFDRYVNDRYGYRLAYPQTFDAEPEAANGDGRVIRGGAATLRVFGVQTRGRSLRAIADSEIDDPAAASETQNSRGSVVLVEEDAQHQRTVKVIALSGARAGVLVVNGPLDDESMRTRLLESFESTAPAVDQQAETDDETRYRNAELGFSIVRPKGARVERDGEDSVSFTVLGPGNEAASEITDGFTLTVLRDTEAQDANLADYAERLRRDGAPSADRIQMAGNTALRYRVQSDLGDRVTYLLFMPGNGRHYQVSYAISGRAADYRPQVEQMLSSLRFD